MKAKVISRSADEFTRERSQDLQRVFRNYDPNLRSQEKSVEYVRALNAAKLDKIFARPFIGAMDGHVDAVSSMAKNPNHLKGIFSGSMDGDIRLWDLAIRRTVCQFPGHQGAVRGLTVSTDGRVLVSCGTDSTVRLWNVPLPSLMDSGDIFNSEAKEPLAVYVWKNAFRAVDHQWNGDLFATAGAQVDIWNHNRSQPVNSFEWGIDTSISVRFNPGEPNILATSGSDRSITLFDLRLSSPARKIIMRVGHLRNWLNLCRVFCVKFSCDASYVISGSDDTNLRLWKAKASEQLGVLLPRERKKHEYLEAVKNRYKHLPEVKRIVRHRHLPKAIYIAASLRRVKTDSERKKTENRRAHSAPGSVAEVSVRKRRIIQEVE
ncbi:uncharacterized protein [Primulina huaijiensis]|uniref:uncharacterized protein n=1 Tax=Primulina huaijiensis TaxID=1492673 RepID=UPI003CC73F3D